MTFWNPDKLWPTHVILSLGHVEIYSSIEVISVILNGEKIRHVVFAPFGQNRSKNIRRVIIDQSLTIQQIDDCSSSHHMFCHLFVFTVS